MYSLILMTAMTASAPEAPQCFWPFQGIFRPVAAACWGGSGCQGCYGGCRGCWGGCYGGCTGYSSGCTGCQGVSYGCGGCAGMSYGYGAGMRASTVYPSSGATPVYIGNEGIWAGTWSYSGIYPGQGPTYIPTTVGKTKMPEASDTSARIILDVPEGAKLYIDGKLMTGTSTERNYYTPALEPGQSYFYDVRIETVKDGKTVAENKKVIVRAGAMVKETFKPIGEPAALASTTK